MRILVVEDEPKTLHAIQQGLEENLYEVDIAYDGLIARQLAMRNNYSLIITDIIMPGLNGFVLSRELRESGIQTPILMLTALGETEDKVNGFDSGADQYLVKPFQFVELLARVRSLTKRGSSTLMTHQTLKFEGLEMNLDTKVVTRDEQVIELTAREFTLLEYMMRNQGRVLSKVQLAENVWDIGFDTGTNFVEVYINYLRKKIDKNFDTKLIHTVFGMGYVLKKNNMQIRVSLTIRFIFIVSTILLAVLLSIYLYTQYYLSESFYRRLSNRTETTAELYFVVDDVDSTLLRTITDRNKNVLHSENITIYNQNKKRVFTTNDRKGLPLTEDLMTKIQLEKKYRFKDGKYHGVGLYYTQTPEPYFIVASAVDDYGRAFWHK
jgi:two-component system copper resistance phosphate regulon response regulator CusR